MFISNLSKSHCPCKSGKSYDTCCRKYHQGFFPENALLLMRSRYSAYSLQLVDYIIETTHPKNKDYTTNKTKWANEIRLFCKNTIFIGLDILEFMDGEKEAYVTFTAHLKQNIQGGRDISFAEKSRFIKENDKWFYVDGLFL